MRARDNKMQELKKEVITRLATVSQDSKYRDLVRFLIAQGLMTLLEHEVTLQCRSEDLQIVQAELPKALQMFQDQMKGATGVSPTCNVSIDKENYLPSGPKPGQQGASWSEQDQSDVHFMLVLRPVCFRSCAHSLTVLCFACSFQRRRCGSVLSSGPDCVPQHVGQPPGHRVLAAEAGGARQAVRIPPENRRRRRRQEGRSLAAQVKSGDHPIGPFTPFCTTFPLLLYLHLQRRLFPSCAPPPLRCAFFCRHSCLTSFQTTHTVSTLTR